MSALCGRARNSKALSADLGLHHDGVGNASQQWPSQKIQAFDLLDSHVIQTLPTPLMIDGFAWVDCPRRPAEDVS